jgi:hypothetical protein
VLAIEHRDYDEAERVRTLGALRDRLGALRSRLSDERLTRHWHEGRLLTVVQVSAEATFAG